MANRRPSRSNEVSELENAFHNLAEKNAGKKIARYEKAAKNAKTRTLIIIVCAILLVAAIILGGWFLYYYTYNNTTIDSNLTIAGVDVSGMTRAEAEDAVTKATENAYANNAMTVRIDEHIVQIPGSIAGITLDVEAAVAAAVNYEQTSADKQALDITAFMTINKDAIIAQLSQLSEHYTSTLTQSSYEVVGEAPVEVVKPDENTVLQFLRITIGTPGIALNLQDLYQNVLDAYNDCVFDVTYTVEVTEPDPVDLEAIYNEVSVAAVEAEMDKETFEVIGGYYGYDFDVDAARVALEGAEYGDVIEIHFRWIEPENTAEELASILFRDTLSSYTTRTSSGYDRATNLRLACEAINGMILYPGDIFSYNGALGERTEAKGYRPGVSYINGESVLDIGGGICQVSSTLYYCAVVADLKIVERWNHAYASAYTPLSTDATVFWGGVDFKFKNNTDYPIRIEAVANGGNVTISLIGTDTKDYYVKFVSERLEVIPFEVEYKEIEEADNEKGYKDGEVITTPYTGYRSRSFRVKYDKETGKKIESKLEVTDYYAARNKVIVKIIGAETEPPDPVTPPPDTPQTPTDAPQTPTDAPQAPTDAPQAPTDAPQTPTDVPQTPVTDPPAEGNDE